jgi:hypothetical protein
VPGTAVFPHLSTQTTPLALRANHNHPTMVKSDIAFGGVKVAGYGNELTELGVRDFLTNKVIDVVASTPRSAIDRSAART